MVVDSSCKANPDHLLIGPLHLGFVKFLRTNQGHVFELIFSTANFIGSCKNLKGLDFVAFSKGRTASLLIIVIKILNAIESFLDATFNVPTVEVKGRYSHQE